MSRRAVRSPHRGIGIVAVLALVVTGFVLTKRSDLLRDLDAAQSESAALESQVERVRVNVALRGDDLTRLRDESATFAHLMRERESFVAAIDAAEAAMAGAKSAIDTSSERDRILRLQDAVLTEREDATVVEAATLEVERVAAAIQRAAAAEQERRRRAAAEEAAGAASAAALGIPDRGYERVRAALDRVGGAGETLRAYGGSCDGVRAPACASRSGVISFSSEVVGWSDARLHWVMAHELAHLRQFGVWDELVSSSGYRSLFGGDIELLANCMAHQRGYPSGTVSCSAEQREWAGAVWRGVVPG